jgi:tetratricopeptide (TPR) repeat protein
MNESFCPSTPRATIRGFIAWPIACVVAAMVSLCGVSVTEAQSDRGAEDRGAQNRSAQVVAAPYSVEGSVTFRRPGESAWREVRVGSSFRVGDTVRTGADGAVAFKFVDGTLVRLGRLSAITFSDVRPTGAPVVNQSEGRSFFFSRGAKNEPEIRTPMVNAAIYGTELVVEVSKNETTIDVLHGAVKATNDRGSLNLAIGERLRARKGAPLERSVLVRPADAVQWMIRFPFIPTKADLIAEGDTDCSAECRAATERVIERVNTNQTMLASLSAESSAFQVSPRGKLLHAIALWRVGDAAAARAVLDALPQSMGGRSRALREILRGYDAIVSGSAGDATKRLQAAQESDSELLNAGLLSSYIAQSVGEIDEALAQIQELRTSYPEVPELMEREAELLLSNDRAKEALRVLTKRNETFGSTAMSATLAGFAALERKEYESAAAHFDEALRMDSAQSLPYLGQALLKAKDRDYTDAKALLSQAIQQDPSSAVYRSYLGKLYFEDENTPKSLEEFEAAIALDPNDPSPYLYRSYSRVANNEPIQALEDVERSIELNDGRAVYRSSLLLDRDTAVRSAGLSRVFTELGFGDAARVEAIKSLTEDYGNFSAHRLLADSYSSILDAEANLSEKRIADLMSPLSFNLFNSIGEQPSFGDYNAMFDKKETRQGARLEWNSNRDQIGGEYVASGKGEDWGYLASYQPYYMSGSRHKAFSGANTFRGALQYEPTVDDRFIVDGTFTMTDVEGARDADYSEDVHIGTLRLGYNKRFSSSWRLLTQAEIGRSRDLTSFDTQRETDLVVPGEDSTIPAEVDALQATRDRIQRNSISSQLLFNSKYLDSVAGAEALYADTSRRELSPVYGFSEFPDYPVQGDLQSSSAGSLTTGQVYEYLSFKVPRRANLTLGLAATSVQQDLTEVPPFKSGENLETAITPKVGLVLTPTKWLTTRAAYFESLSRKPVLEDLTSLEPTLIGGINQRFNDLSGAYSRNLGFGIDVKDSNTLYAGAQYTRRNIRESFGDVSDLTGFDGETLTSLDPTSRGFYDSHSESDIFRGYISAVLSPQSVLTSETLNQWYHDTGADSNFDVNTQRHRFGYKHFLGKHLSLGVQATYRDQSAAYIDDPQGFWLFDAGVSYRFAEQRGRVFARIDNILDRNFTYDQSVGLETPLLEGRSFVVGVAYNFW